jgi:hypothetical protein
MGGNILGISGLTLYNGTTARGLANVSGQIFALTPSGSSVYMGGNITTCSGSSFGLSTSVGIGAFGGKITCSGFAYFNNSPGGNSFIGYSVSGNVYALANVNNTIYLGGNIIGASGGGTRVIGNNILSFNGSTFSTLTQLNGSINSPVYSIISSSGSTYGLSGGLYGNIVLLSGSGGLFTTNTGLNTGLAMYDTVKSIVTFPHYYVSPIPQPNPVTCAMVSGNIFIPSCLSNTFTSLPSDSIHRYALTSGALQLNINNIVTVSGIMYIKDLSNTNMYSTQSVNAVHLTPYQPLELIANYDGTGSWSQIGTNKHMYT